MKPKPFSALNHFTVPWTIVLSPHRDTYRSAPCRPLVARMAFRMRKRPLSTSRGRSKTFEKCNCNQEQVSTPPPLLVCGTAADVASPAGELSVGRQVDALRGLAPVIAAKKRSFPCRHLLVLIRLLCSFGVPSACTATR